jgi:hypothetical protein
MRPTGRMQAQRGLAEIGPLGRNPMLALVVVALMARWSDDAAPMPPRALLADPSAVYEPDAVSTAARRTAIGTADPVTVVAHARNGRWVLACQPGDGMHLFRGEGAGRPIDELAARSRDDRWLAVVRSGALIVVDDADGSEHVVPSAEVHGMWPYVTQVAAFDRESQHLIYFRAVDGARTVAMRDLADQRDREIAIPGASVLTVDPEPGTAWARLQLVRSDAGADASFRWQDSRHDLMSETCSGRIAPPPPPSPPGQYEKRTVIQTAWLKLDTGQLRKDPSVLAYLGDVGVVKSADGAIRVGSTKVVPRGCNTEVLFASALPLRIIASCKSAGPRAPLEMFGPNLHVVLPGTMRPEYRPEKVDVVDAGYVCLDGGNCFELQDGAQVSLRGIWRAFHGNHILSSDRGRYFVVDRATGVVTRLPGVTGPLVRAAEGIVAIDTRIVDIDHARVIGEIVRWPLAVDLHGRALLPANLEHLAPRGPLRWVLPRPMTTPADPADDAADEPPPVVEAVAVDGAGKPMKSVPLTIRGPRLECSAAWPW